MKRLSAWALCAALLLTLCACAPAEPTDPDPAPAPEGPTDPDTPDVPDPQPQLMADPYDLGWNRPCASAMGTGERAAREQPTFLRASYELYEHSDVTMEMHDGIEVYRPTVVFDSLRDEGVRQAVRSAFDGQIDALIAAMPQIDLTARMAALNAEAADVSYYLPYNLTVVGNLLSFRAWSELSCSYYDAEGGYLSWEVERLYPAACYLDLRTGQTLALSDLFAPDCDYAALLNREVAAVLSREEYELARPFLGLSDDYPLIDLSATGVTIEMSDQSPYLGSDMAFSDYGTSFSLPIEKLYGAMPILWGDPADHLDGDDARSQLYVPPQYELRMTSRPIALPDGLGEAGPFPFVAGGVDEGVLAAITVALEELHAQSEQWYATHYGGSSEDFAYADAGYNVVGPYLSVRCWLSISLGTQALSQEMTAVFDLRTGAALTPRELVADQGAALDALLAAGLSEQEAAAALDSPRFTLDSSLYLSGEQFDEKWWSLDTPFFDLSLLEGSLQH